MAQSQQQPDVPIVKANTGQFAVYQRMRLKKSLLHLPSICYLMVTENPKVFLESGLAPFDKCTVYIGPTLAMTAYVIAVEPHIEKVSHQVGVDLAAPTLDAVECSVDVDALAAGAGSWSLGAGTVGSAAKLITGPYNINVESIQDVPLDTGYPIPGAAWRKHAGRFSKSSAGLRSASSTTRRMAR
jgi:prophage tail gpP-like protein